ncbi:unnamed protein product [Callosobruchus maculatus]|uniref:SWIM-type domain-containing protein n=1 Tax=Callosobruchus maculatus TaxID=64391 RepID=A0A653DD40_CALMS|nr:unnamed protein product [Callosobruchus maculatus]
MILRSLDNKMFQKSVVSDLAVEALREAERTYKMTGILEEHILENLYSFFGDNLLSATELLDKCKLIQYTLQEDTRSVYKIITSKEQCTIYDNINFCHCETFRVDVLEKGESFTCKHVLAVKLGKIMNMATKEVVSGAQMVEFLNEQFISLTES